MSAVTYRTLVLGLCLLVVNAGLADQERPIREARSENQRYALRVDPGRPGRAQAIRPRATLFERSVDGGRRRTIWRAKLVNDLSPARAFIRNDGRFVVTLDEFRRGGAAHALVIYNRSGKLLREFDLRELLRGDDWKHVTVERKAVKWLGDARCAFVDDPPQFVASLEWKREIRIDLEKLGIVGGKVGGTEADESNSTVVPPEILALLDQPDSTPNLEGHSRNGDGEDAEGAVELLCEVAKIFGLELDPAVAIDSADDRTGPASEASLASAEVEITIGTPADAESSVEDAAEDGADSSMVSETPQPRFAGNSAEAGWGVPMPDPKNPVDYVAWVMEHTVTDGPSAVPLYEAAIAQCHDFDGDWDVVEAAMLGDPEALARPEIAAYLEMHRDALANYHAAPQFEYRGMPEPGDSDMVFEILLPSLSKARHLAKMSVLQAKYLEADGDVDGALDSYLSTLAVGAQMSHGVTLIDNLVGNAIQGLVADSLLDSLASKTGEEVDYTRLAEGLEANYRPLQPMAIPFQGERACCLGAIQKLYDWVPETHTYAVSDDGLQYITQALFGQFGPDDPELPPATKLRAALETLGFENMVAEANELYDTATRAALAPYREGNRIWDEIETRLESADYREHNPLLAAMVPALSRTTRLATRAETQRNATRLIANLRAYQQRHGTYPESLDVFGDSAMTIDAYAGDRFVYRSDGNSFTLYSLGGNGVDDGGQHDPRGDTNDVVYWPRPKK